METEAIRNYYDIMADEYARLYFNELDKKPLDRSILERFSQLTKNMGKVCDMGCGPGEVARLLKDNGSDVFGIDLSEEMISKARMLSSDIVFEQGDMCELNIESNHLAGIAAFYAIVHFCLSEVETVLKEFHRVIMNGGFLLISFHVGSDIIGVEKSDGDKNVKVDFVFHDPDVIIGLIEKTGFKVEEAVIRYPYIGVEYSSRRAYILARK